MRRWYVVVLPLLAAMALEAPAKTSRPKRAACLAACALDIETCAQTGKRAKCRRQLVRKCRKRGLDVCTVPTTTSTTTSTMPEPKVTTTTQGVPTSSTVVPTTTTSTTEPPRQVRGIIEAYKVYGNVPFPNAALCSNVAVAFLIQIENVGVPDLTVSGPWNYAGCPAATVSLSSVPTDYVEDFFNDEVFSQVTTDPAAAQPCDAGVSIPVGGTARCTVWALQAVPAATFGPFDLFPQSGCGPRFSMINDAGYPADVVAHVVDCP